MRSRARLPYKLGFNNGPVTISHLNSHSGKRLAAKLIPHHIRKRAGRFLLRRLDVRQFHPLFIESDVIAVGDIEKVSCHRRSTPRDAERSYWRGSPRCYSDWRGAAEPLCREVREIRNGPPKRTVAVGD